MVNKKLVVIGDGTVGKTCLLVVFSKGEFPTDYTPTVFDKYVADIEVNGNQVALVLWDTAGQEDYDRLRPLSYNDPDVILMCFNIDNPGSLENIREKWAPEAEHFCPNCPIILVGNMKDLRTDPKTIDELAVGTRRPVQPEDGKAMADEIGAVCYMECSAKENDGVREVFEAAAKATLKTKIPLRARIRQCSIL
uniref:Ras-like GTP-binding protein Rho1 n=1 Tax=Strigamia maritima TaxID=126957 RepID=T1JBX3_STRMM